MFSVLTNGTSQLEKACSNSLWGMGKEFAVIVYIRVNQDYLLSVFFR